MHRLVPFAILAVAAWAPPGAEGAGAPRAISFAPGASSATLGGAVVRGERDLYTFRARKGQRATLSISAPEDNAAFELATIAPRGRTALAAEARRWSGVLPHTGSYVVAVGGTRGNAEYQLQVRID